MLTDLSPVRAAGPAAVPPAPGPDAAYAALPRLTRLRDALVAAARARPRASPSGWSEPPVFFFDRRRQAEFAADRPERPPTVPAGTVEAHVAAELPALFASVEVRRAARAVPGLRETAAVLARALPAARDLADLLAVPDDETVLVLHPSTRAGFRLVVRGVVDVAQFHLLMLDALTGDPAAELLPGPRPPSRFRTACADPDPVIPAGVPMLAEARYQLFGPSAVLPDGSVPPGFRGSDHWLWGHRPFTAVPRVDGERVVVLGDPSYRVTWEVERRFPALPAEVRLLKVLGPFEVAERLGRFAGRPLPVHPPARPVPIAAAA